MTRKEPEENVLSQSNVQSLCKNASWVSRCRKRPWQANIWSTM